MGDRYFGSGTSLWCYDAECFQWDQHIRSAARSSKGETHIFKEKEAIKKWYYSLPQDATIIAFNGGKYDALLLADVIGGKGVPMEASFAGSAVSSLRIDGGPEILDSARLFPTMSLHEASRAFGDTPKQELDLKCICGDDCGGYCQIRPDASRSILKLVEEYNVHDCDATIDSYLSLIEYALDHGINVLNRYKHVRRTCGGWAWASAKEICDVGESLSWGDYMAHRSAYAGGHCEVLRWRADVGERFDLRSAYPAAMRDAMFPAGSYKPSLDPIMDYVNDRPGLYSGIVHVPEPLPLLPARGPDGGLIWHTGYVVGSWTNIELKAAEEHGAKIIVLDDALIWARTDRVLKPFIDHFWKLREAAIKEGNKPRSKWCKAFMNSLSGKLAQRNASFFKVVFHPADVDEGWWHLGRDIYAIPIDRIPDCARPVLACTITAATRIKIMDALSAAGDDAIYTDTDSIYRIGMMNMTGSDTDLGTWQHEGSLSDWFAAAPKMYRYTDQKGEKHARAKGIPQATSKDVDDLHHGKTITRERGVETMRIAMRRDGPLFKRRKLERSLRFSGTLCGRRARNDDGSTTALHRDESGVWSWPGTVYEPDTYFRDLY